MRFPASYLARSAALVASVLAMPLNVAVAASWTSDVAYGDLPKQILDIHMPTSVDDSSPVLVFLHGGGFKWGDKTQALVFAPQYKDAGIIVVSPDYRLGTAFPGFVEDAAKAVAYVHREFTTSDGNPRPIFVSGWSAGAYIGAKVSYDHRYLEAEGVPRDAIAGFIGLAGPYWGGLCAGARCEDIFPEGAEADWPIAKFVDAGDPPMLLIQGSRDLYVDIGNLETMASAGEAANLPVTTLVVEGSGHRTVLFDMPKPEKAVNAAILSFVEDVSSSKGK